MGLPFLKWPGGKRWLAPLLVDIVKEIKIENYFEPFLGGGAVFFKLKPNMGILSDINEDLINTYVQVKDNHQIILRLLKEIPVNKKTYLRIRKVVPECPIQRAVRFLYLNRTAFSGMYRLNKKGEFNVPYGGGGRTPEILWENDLLANASKYLSTAEILNCDFEQTLSKARHGDFIYCDPTYTVTHNHNGFIRYNEKNFSWNDQKRLAICCKEAANRGASVIVSNAFHESVNNLYSDSVRYVLKRKSLLSPNPANRVDAFESLFIYNLKLDHCVERYEKLGLAYSGVNSMNGMPAAEGA
jgi:DNA adenine methylase